MYVAVAKPPVRRACGDRHARRRPAGRCPPASWHLHLPRGMTAAPNLGRPGSVPWSTKRRRGIAGTGPETRSTPSFRTGLGVQHPDTAPLPRPTGPPPRPPQGGGHPTFRRARWQEYGGGERVWD